MDQVKIGKFIAQCRKINNLTQVQLAEKLDITDRAISKWETGKGIPDSSIMLKLCNELGINVNELLSGERIKMEEYNKKAEENLIELKRQEEKFAKPAMAAIIIKNIDGQEYILVQERHKEDGGKENGMLEIPGGKIREYENIFDTVRREVLEETGLKIYEIQGENQHIESVVNGNKIISIEPYCVTQNLSGAYSLLVITFICKAEGNLLEKTDETQNIRWERCVDIKEKLLENQNQFFLMHVNALKKYFNI